MWSVDVTGPAANTDSEWTASRQEAQRCLSCCVISDLRSVRHSLSLWMWVWMLSVDPCEALCADWQHENVSLYLQEVAVCLALMWTEGLSVCLSSRPDQNQQHRGQEKNHIHTASWICLLRLYKDTASSWYCIEIWFVLMYKLDDTCRQNHDKCEGQLIECTLGVFVIVLD